MFIFDTSQANNIAVWIELTAKDPNAFSTLLFEYNLKNTFPLLDYVNGTKLTIPAGSTQGF